MIFYYKYDDVKESIKTFLKLVETERFSKDEYFISFSVAFVLKRRRINLLADLLTLLDRAK